MPYFFTSSPKMTDYAKNRAIIYIFIPDFFSLNITKIVFDFLCYKII